MAGAEVRQGPLTARIALNHTQLLKGRQLAKRLTLIDAGQFGELVC